MPPTDSSTSHQPSTSIEHDRQTAIDALLERPIDQRLREFKYRFAQSIVFGLPVIALRLFGERLSNADESQRWVAIYSIVLTGWIVFVAAAGMISEGGVLLLARRRVTADFVVAAGAMLAYLFSCISATGILWRGTPLVRPLLFHVVAGLLIVWCGARWLQLRGRVKSS